MTIFALVIVQILLVMLIALVAYFGRAIMDLLILIEQELRKARQQNGN